MLEVKEKTAVITGGASGIGLAIAQQWVNYGGNVVIGDFNADTLRSTKELLGESCETITCDVTKEFDTEKLAQTAIDKFGSINLCVPCAGIIMDMMTVSPNRNDSTKVTKMPLEKWQKVIDVNLTGTFLTVRDCLEQMILSNSTGCVVTISSTGSLGTAGQLNYSSTKAAMSVFPKVLMAELMRRKLSSKIRVNAVAPGYTATAMTKGMNQEALEKIEAEIPKGRMVEPEEVASLIIELYRNESLAGEVYWIHGGLRLGSKG